MLNVAAFSVSAPMTTSLSCLKGPQLSEILISVKRTHIYGTRVRWTSQVALVVKNLPANAGNARDTGSVPGLERSSGEGNGNSPFLPEESHKQRSLEATVHRVAKSQT